MQILILIESLTTSVFIRSVSAIFFAVTEQATFNTLTITTSQRVLWAKRFIGVQKWLNLAFLVLGLAVPDSFLPVTSLFLNIEVQTGWTTDSLKTLGIRLRVVYLVLNCF